MARPTTSSECPRPYTAAVSTQLIPSRMARRMAAIEVAVGLVTPGERPASPAGRPRAEPGLGDLWPGAAEPSQGQSHRAVLLSWPAPEHDPLRAPVP